MVINKHYHSVSNRELVTWMNETPFAAMLTIKFMNSQNNYECINQLNKLIRNLNSFIYGRQFAKRNLFINGFVVIEKNIKKSPNNFHIHLLVKRENKLNRFNINELLHIAIKSSEKLKDKFGNTAFPHGEIRVTINSDNVNGYETDCIHIIEPYDEYAAAYIAKTATDSGYDQIKFLSLHGLSDTDMSFMHHHKFR